MTHAVELYACLYAREFPAQALLRLRPDERDKAVAVLDGEPPLQTVCSFNAKARMRGITYGMTRVELETFSSVVLLSRSISEEFTARSALLECAGAFSPRVEDRSERTAFLCVIDIAGTDLIFGSPQILVQKLLGRVRDLGIVASVVVSRNAHAAISQARGGSKQAVFIAAGSEAGALSLLPLSTLSLSAQQAETFELWGIQTLGELAALPERELIARMGQEGKQLRQLARGELTHLFVPVEPEFSLAERMELDTPIELLEPLLFVFGLMLEQLIMRAIGRVLALASVTTKLSLEGGMTHYRTVRPALPSNDRQLWINLLHLDLEAHPPQAAILAVKLEAEPGGTSKVQLGLFSPQLPETTRLDVTLARIRAIVGEACVGRIVLNDTHKPDSFRVEPFTIPSKSAATQMPGQSVAAMRQLRPAERVTITLRDGQLSAFTFRENQYQVEHAYGPWRTNGDWWNPTLWKVEQWDVIAHSIDGVPLCCCLMRDKHLWQMVALYD